MIISKASGGANLKSINKILIIGGDTRQIYMADYLEKSGFDIEVYGLSDKKRTSSENIRKSINNADAIILPLPVSKDGKYITSCVVIKETLDEIISFIKEDSVVFAGLMNRNIESKLIKKNIKYFDYFKREEVTIKNTVPTVQGILKTIIDNINYTIHSSKCAVFGYGRVAKITADVLKFMGADVTVCARKKSDLSLAETRGIKGILIEDFHKYSDGFEIIINTVPSVVIDRKILEKLKKDCLIIDVSSAPYGTDFACASEFGINALQCPSLPGKVAPKTAGIIIAEAIINILKEENLWV